MCFGCLNGLPKPVQVPFSGIEAPNSWISPLGD